MKSQLLETDNASKVSFVKNFTFPFKGTYEAGKTGPVRGRLVWASFSYKDTWPGIIFALCVLTGVRQGWIQIQQMKEDGVSIFLVIMLVCYGWWALYFAFEFSYWLGVQRGVVLRKQRDQQRRNERRRS